MADPEPKASLPYLLPPFEGARLKISRGLYHRNELEAALTAYAETVELVFGPMTPTHQKLVTLKPEPPFVFALILGDCVHNLRSALDITMVDIARLRNRSADIRFPFADTQEIYAATVEKRFSKYGDEVVAALMHLKAYKGGNQQLRALHDLDIDDKHKLVMPVIGAAATIMDGNRIMSDGFAAQFGGTPGNYVLNTDGTGSFTVTDASQAYLFAMIGARPEKSYFVHNKSVPVPPDGDETKYYSGYLKEVTAQFPEEHPYLPRRNVLTFLDELIKTTTQIVEGFRTKFG